MELVTPSIEPNQSPGPHWAKILIPLVVLIVLIVGGYFIFFSPEEYYVRSISSHYEHPNDNSETSLVVYESGQSGNVKNILCLFPPDFHLDNGARSSTLSNDDQNRLDEILFGDTQNSHNTLPPVLSGIRKVRVLKEAQKYMFGEVGYYCEKIE